MARPLRIEQAGGWYHLTARGDERQPICRDQRDYQHLCQLLGEAVERFRWRLHAYVLMKNHFHLLTWMTWPPKPIRPPGYCIMLRCDPNDPLLLEL